MKVGVAGGRLAGAYVSLLVTKVGHEVLLFDPGAESEKPCGGGVTAKALRKILWLQKNSLPHKEIRTLRISSRTLPAAELHLQYPIHIFSRSTLDLSLRDATVRSGAKLGAEKVQDLKALHPGWVIKTKEGEVEVDLVIGADGARSLVRSKVAGRLKAS